MTQEAQAKQLADQLAQEKVRQRKASEKHNTYLSKKYSEFYSLMLQPDSVKSKQMADEEAFLGLQGAS